MSGTACERRVLGDFDRQARFDSAREMKFREILQCGMVTATSGQQQQGLVVTGLQCLTHAPKMQECGKGHCGMEKIDKL